MKMAVTGPHSSQDLRQGWFFCVAVFRRRNIDFRVPQKTIDARNPSEMSRNHLAYTKVRQLTRDSQYALTSTFESQLIDGCPASVKRRTVNLFSPTETQSPIRAWESQMNISSLRARMSVLPVVPTFNSPRVGRLGYHATPAQAPAKECNTW